MARRIQIKPFKHRPIHFQSARILNTCNIIEMIADSERQTVNTLLTIIHLAERIDADCYLLQSSIAIHHARFNPDQLTHIPGSRFEQKECREIYRCWACGNFGGRCINRWLNRPACAAFILNDWLSDQGVNSLSRMRKSRGNRPPKIKPFIIPAFNKHIQTCSICDRIFKAGKKNKWNKMQRHYDKIVGKLRIKLATLFKGLGIRYREDYIGGWEE